MDQQLKENASLKESLSTFEVRSFPASSFLSNLCLQVKLKEANAKILDLTNVISMLPKAVLSLMSMSADWSCLDSSTILELV